MLCYVAFCSVLLLADHLPAPEAPPPERRVPIGNAAVERWLATLEGHWHWSDGARHGDVVLRPVAGGLALAGSGSGFGSGGESSWLILWDAAPRELVVVVISSSGEHCRLRHAVSGTQLKGDFLGTSESADGHRKVRGECVWQLASRDAFSIAWKPWYIADMGQFDRRFDFQRKK
jgi:hypothetical protein